jgi:plasmid stability protein
MANQTLTLEVPGGLYTRLKERAEQAHRSVEAELLDVLATVVAEADDLPADLNQALTSLELLDDEELGRAARGGLARTLAAELEALHFKQQREGLTEAERQRCAELVRQYERAMLLRAQAVAVLRQRGHDVSSLAVLP